MLHKNENHLRKKIVVPIFEVSRSSPVSFLILVLYLVSYYFFLLLIHKVEIFLIVLFYSKFTCIISIICVHISQPWMYSSDGTSHHYYCLDSFVCFSSPLISKHWSNAWFTSWNYSVLCLYQTLWSHLISWLQILFIYWSVSSSLFPWMWDLDIKSISNVTSLKSVLQISALPHSAPSQFMPTAQAKTLYSHLTPRIQSVTQQHSP